MVRWPNFALWNVKPPRTPMKRFSSYFGLAGGVVVTIPLAIIAVLAGGAGHGSYLPMRVFFPFTMFSTFPFWLYHCSIRRAWFGSVPALWFPFRQVRAFGFFSRPVGWCVPGTFACPSADFHFL